MWTVEKSRRHDHLAGAQNVLVGVNLKRAVLTLEALHAFVQAVLEAFAVGHLAVIFDALLARRLVAVAGEGIPADLEQVGRGKELHLRWIADQRVDRSEERRVGEESGE